MSGRSFLDSNILIYLLSKDEAQKKSRIESLLNTADQEFWISTQVLNEVANVLRRKFQVSYQDVQPVIDDFSQRFKVDTVDIDTIRSAIDIGTRYGYRYFDCLMLASALKLGCTILYSEDMQDRQQIEHTLTITNPLSSLNSP